MAVNFRSANAQLAAVVQSGAGTEGSPSAASDAIRVAGEHPIQWGAEFLSLDTNYASASVSDSAPSVSPGKGTLKLKAYLSGSTTGGATGDPDYGRLLQGCGMSESKLAADASGTAQAGVGGTNSSITLAAGDAQGDGFYVGMTLRT